MMRVILPGSYDPVTLGHLDLIRRAAERYEEVYAVIFRNPDKQYTFSLQDRLCMLSLATEEWSNVLVSFGNGLVIDYMREHGIQRIIKGYRNESDLAYEREQAAWNLSHGGYTTEFWRSDPNLRSVSSTEARRRIAAGEGLSDILPQKVIAFLKNH